MTIKGTQNGIAVISTLGIFGWMLADFYGGMDIFLLFWFLLIPIIILYLISISETVYSIIKKGFRENKLKIIFHSMPLLAIAGFMLFQSEIFKSKRVLTAILRDDFASYTLIFRENGKVENDVRVFIGKEKFTGEYYISGDTIIFTKIPYDKDFISERMLIDREQNALFFHSDKNGNFSREKVWLYYFEIQ